MIYVMFFLKSSLKISCSDGPFGIKIEVTANIPKPIATPKGLPDASETARMVPAAALIASCAVS